MTVKLLKKWISLNSLPLIVPYQRKYMKVMFNRDNGVTTHLLFFSSAEYLNDHAETQQLLEKMATEYRGRLFVVHILDSDTNMLEFFGVDPSSLPTLSIVVLFALSHAGEERRERGLQVRLPRRLRGVRGPRVH